MYKLHISGQERKTWTVTIFIEKLTVLSGRSGHKKGAGCKVKMEKADTAISSIRSEKKKLLRNKKANHPLRVFRFKKWS